jgi:hypothetical protein
MWQLETAILSKNNLICKHLTVMSDLCLESTVKDYLMQGSQATEPFKTLVFILFYCMKIVDMDGRNNANLHQLIEKMLEPAEAQSLVIRNCAKNTCRLLVQFYGASMMPLIQATVHSFITESESYRQSDPERWWKTREACLYGVSNIPKDIFMDNPECFDLQGFLKGVVSSDITEYGKLSLLFILYYLVMLTCKHNRLSHFTGQSLHDSYPFHRTVLSGRC